MNKPTPRAAYKLSAEKRETVVNFNSADKLASVFTWSRKLQASLAANPDAIFIAEGFHKHPDDRWQKYEVPKGLVAIRKRRKMTPEQARAAGDRMRALKAAV